MNDLNRMSTLFISDLHLYPRAREITAAFINFLKFYAIRADALYILGDLFEAWSGDDNHDPWYDEIAAALKSLHQSGVPCYFIHGNRDFLLGKHFSHASGMQLLPEQAVLKLYGHHILILHGDTLCTDDAAYQKFRCKVRNPLMQKFFLALPRSWRLAITTKMRVHSQLSNQCKLGAIMDVNLKSVEQIMLYHGVFWMIHGHTHRPAIHRLDINNRKAYRLVLGAWHLEGSMIRVSPHTVQMITFPL